jgi:hypothetical protein
MASSDRDAASPDPGGPSDAARANRAFWDAVAQEYQALRWPIEEISELRKRP